MSKNEMNDTIYRQDALGKAYRLDLHDTGNDVVLNVIDVDAIKALSPAQPSPCEFCKHNDVAADGICLRCPAERRTE